MKTPKSPETKNSTFDVIKKHSRKITTATAFTILLITSSFAPRLCATAGVKQQAPASTKQVKKEPRPKNNRHIKSLPKKTTEFEKEVLSKIDSTIPEEMPVTEENSISPYQQQLPKHIEEKWRKQKEKFIEEKRKFIDAEKKTPGILSEIIELASYLDDLVEYICTRDPDTLDYYLFVDLLKTHINLHEKLIKLGGMEDQMHLSSPSSSSCSIEKIINQIEDYAQLLTEDSIDIPVYEKFIMLKNLEKLITDAPDFPANVEVKYSTNELANQTDQIDEEERAQQRSDYIIKILQKIDNSDEDFPLSKELEQHYKDLLSLMGYQEGEIDEKDFL